jgi:hypothetical protein
MNNVNFEVEKSRENQDFKPISLSDGSVIKMQSESNGANVAVRGTVEKNGKEIGRISWSTEFNRLTISLNPLDALESSVALEAVDVFTAGLHNVLDNKD